MTSRIVRLTPEQIPLRLDEIEAVYLGAFAHPPYSADATAARLFRDQQLRRHAAYEDFRLVAAEEGTEFVGFAYGYTGREGMWWTDLVAGAVPAEQVPRWLGGHFEFVEIAVLPRVQRRGIGSALHDALLSGLPHRTALLSTRREETSALRLYRRKGWQVVVPEFYFPGNAAPYVILGLDLASRAARTGTFHVHQAEFVRVHVPGHLERSLQLALAGVLAPFFTDREGTRVTAVLQRGEWERLASRFASAEVTSGLRLVTVLVPGADAAFSARLRRVLAEGGVEAILLPSFHNDYVLVREDQVPRGLEAISRLLAG